MSYGIAAYAVDIKKVRSQVGSGDAELAEQYAASFPEHRQHVQEHVNELRGDDTVTLADIARQVIMGEPYDERLGSAYGYFLEHLCDRTGERLHDHGFPSFSGWDYLRVVDEAHESAGLLAPGFSLEGLISSGSPVPLPHADFPAIGHMFNAELLAPADLLATAPNTSLNDDEFGRPSYALFQWLAYSEGEGVDLVTFYY
ncbi:DUF7691 family protein [Actinoplanes palleronii]|uniref:DUF7691 domain-containing protein n=1 Tax=Actinoplanes palleronii TaxID=113570 RepID=A0ABQ4BMF9_9ACTN|nr:hypothetical protein [Actinoplanes palleronii]GIE71870.1 hypothetical protein Apa02nite_079780 [Actinoplanes palleronii]